MGDVTVADYEIGVMTMGTRSLRTSLGTFSALAVVLAGAGLAWACSPQAYIKVNPTFGAGGSQVRVDGARFAEAAEATAGPVEIRWNSVNGPKLADTVGPAFSVTVTVPNVRPGAYTILAVRRDPGGQIFGIGRAGFTVTGSQPSANNGGGTTGDSTAPSSQGGNTIYGSTDGGDGEQEQVSPTENNVSQPQPSDPAANSARSGSRIRQITETRQGNSDSTVGSSAGSRRPAVTSVPRAADERSLSSASSRVGTVTTSSGQRAFSGSVGNATTRNEGASNSPATARRAAPAASGAPAVVDQAVVDDLFSGFAQGSSSAPALADQAQASNTQWQLAVGAGLAAFGITAMFGAAIVTQVRRRRALAHLPTD